MSTHPYLPLYVDDYDAATTHLTVEEDGVYGRLLRLSWRTPGCSLPNDPTWIARKTRLSADDFERVAKPILDEFFTLQRGRLVQRRLKREYDDISRKKSARKAAGKRGGEAKARKTYENDPGNTRTLPADTRASPKPEPEPEPKISELNPAAAVEQPPRADDWPGGDTSDHRTALLALAGPGMGDPAREPGLFTTMAEIARWRAAGCSWSLDVLPVVQGKTQRARQSPIRTWSVLTADVLAAKARREAEIAAPAYVPGETGPPRTSGELAAAERRRGRELLEQKLAAQS